MIPSSVPSQPELNTSPDGGHQMVRLWAAVILFFSLSCALSVPGNPDYLLPLVPELLLCAGLATSFILYQKSSPNLKTLWLTNREIALYAAILLALGLYVLPRMIWSLSHTPHQVWDPCENIAPSAFVRLECYLQGAIIQFPGPRQFYMLASAVLVGAIAFLFSRLIQEGQRFILTSIALFAWLYCFAIFMGIFLGYQTLLPEYLGRSEFGAGRFSLVIPNPSWVWPYLAPGLVCSFWAFTASTSRIKKIVFLIGAGLISYSMFKTGQRGGLLLATVLWGVFAHFQIKTQYFANRKTKIVAAVILLLLLTLGLIWGQKAYTVLMAGLGRTEFIDVNRLAIWKLALPHVLSHQPLFGFGYASWFQEYRTIATPAGAPLFDTAHNLYVQLFFEHGLVGSLLILGLLLAIAVLSWKNNRALMQGRLVAALATFSFICCTAVQEVDYIRPTFYMHALMWGALLGARHQEGLPDVGHELKNEMPYFIFKRGLFADQMLAKWRKYIVLAILMLLLLSGFSARYFSIGAFPFEGDLAHKTERVGRWLGPFARLNSFGRGVIWQYSIVSQTKGNAVLHSYDQKACEVKLEPQSKRVLSIYTFSKIYPSSLTLEFIDKQIDGNRFISSRVEYPPELIEGNADETTATNCTSN